MHASIGGGDLCVAFDALKQIAQAGVGVDAQLFHFVAMRFKDRRKEGAHCVTEDDRVGDLHHRGFHVEREKRAFGFGLFDLVCEERAERCCAHIGGINHCARRVGNGVFQDSFT